MRSLQDITGEIQNITIVHYTIPAIENFPNNGHLSLIVYKGALPGMSKDRKAVLKELLESNGWTGTWEDSIFDYHHYHSTAHEVLAIVKGTTLVQFGGPSGKQIPLEAGDVVVIPAGVAHKRQESDEDFLCIGAYPDGQKYDMMYGKAEEFDLAVANIERVPLPTADPLYGTDGPLMTNWNPPSLKTDIQK